MDVRTANADHRPLPKVQSSFGKLPADAAIRGMVAACDLALLIDSHGIVEDVTLGAPDLADHGVRDWLGRRWVDTVLPENRGKIDDLLAGKGDPGRWRQVNHPSPAGDLPMRYLAIPAGDGRVLAVGRDMRAAAAQQQRLLKAQQAMERDSLQLRQLEARYRLLFDTTQDAIIVIDATSRRIADINPAARRLTGFGAVAIDGQPFTSLVDPGDREAISAQLGAIAAAEQRHPVRLHLTSGDACLMSATLFRQDRGSFLLLRLRPLVDTGTSPERPLVEVLERMPDAFVLTNDTLDIIVGNGAFLDMVHVTRRDDITGQPLSRFLGRPGIDLGLLESQLRDHGLVRNFATIVRARDGSEEDVEISAVTSVEGGDTRHGFSIRSTMRRVAAASDDRQLPRSVEQLTELVGRVSLKEIVRESTDLIERLCIEAALTYTSDNRASAAEILGLSRQSLYSKLHRHGLGNLSDPG
ncbi:transcriptional regulator PpsR [Polymorphobacter fuscus]|uniref:Transcriptional regulator PpsR n=1 Tax=Sandarakinorhabdus fusca TaxID=1439888 RepID=A0A7C9LHA7_9SPHN|nr:transcriptional regulator PpsR [Polymorphobacter fuscus]KAB7644849.1 transcriptional regulator PpsR [Polymorphobacter fuscus]MQT18127.1 transcriptional regulator PpsR [Polymorphobacter fuscus]NJC09445.1 transcriptional regulator PpsR [Polymorphobacter fuscus]